LSFKVNGVGLVGTLWAVGRLVLLLSPPLVNRVTMKSFQLLMGTTPAVTVGPICSGCSPVLLPTLPPSAATCKPMGGTPIVKVPPFRVTVLVPSGELELDTPTVPLLMNVPPE